MAGAPAQFIKQSPKRHRPVKLFHAASLSERMHYICVAFQCGIRHSCASIFVKSLADIILVLPAKAAAMPSL
jgi:hypothetical protein